MTNIKNSIFKYSFLYEFIRYSKDYFRLSKLFSPKYSKLKNSHIQERTYLVMVCS